MFLSRQFIRHRILVFAILILALQKAARLEAQISWPPSEGNKFCATAGVVENTADGNVDFPRDTSILAGAGPALLSSRSPSLSGLRVGRWSPADATHDLFDGCWDDTGNFVRMEFLFDEFHNPPGPVGLVDFNYNPYQYGIDPVFGWFDIDIDDNIDTGGDIDTFANRYVGNIARFGGLPPPPIAYRTARSGNDNDTNPATTPSVERSGEDFHLALFGGLTVSIDQRVGDNDGAFEPNEGWVLTGHFLHRAHAYEMFSSANGNGSYEPLCQIEFKHFAAFDATRIAWVYPLDQAGAAEQLGLDAEDIVTDADDTNANSLAEAMTDLVNAVNLLPAGSPLTNNSFFNLIAPWETANPADFLDPSNWRLTALVGTAYPQQDFFGALLAWTDAFPRPLLGDFNGDGAITPGDVAYFNIRLQLIDGMFPFDVDNAVNGSVVIPNFGPNFDILDLDYNGIIDEQDRDLIIIPGDVNGDLAVNNQDIAALVQALLEPTVAVAVCPDTSNFGACCVFTGSFELCVDTDRTTCAMQGGSFQGQGTNCLVEGCPLSIGACCVPPNMFQGACIEFSQNDCANFGGNFLGPNTTCAANTTVCDPNSAPGACCANAGGLPPCLVLSETECQNLGGAFQGSNTACDPATGGCPTGGTPNTTGACCISTPMSSTCQSLSEQDCLAGGGIFFGPDSLCANVPCVPPLSPAVACCNGAAGCTDVDLLTCINQGGVPIAPGASCLEAAQALLMPRADLNNDDRIDGLDIQTMIDILVSE